MNESATASLAQSCRASSINRFPLSTVFLSLSAMQNARALFGRADKNSVLDVCGRSSSSGSIDKLILRPDSILIHRRRQEGITSPRNLRVSTTALTAQGNMAPKAAEAPGSKLPHALSATPTQQQELTTVEGGAAATRHIHKSDSLLKRDSGKVRFA